MDLMTKDKDGKDVKSDTAFKFREGDLQPWKSLDNAVVVVSGAFALLRSAEPLLDRDAARRRLEDTAQLVDANNPLDQGRLARR